MITACKLFLEGGREGREGGREREGEYRPGRKGREGREGRKVVWRGRGGARDWHGGIYGMHLQTLLELHITYTWMGVGKHLTRVLQYFNSPLRTLVTTATHTARQDINS